MAKNTYIIAVFLMFVLPAKRLRACSTFSLNTLIDSGAQNSYTAQNFDWYQSLGYGFILPRGQKKIAFLIDTTAKALEWKSKYGSLSFSPIGPGFTVNGINETGLSVMVMQDETENHSPPEWLNTTPEINELQFPQYILDSSSNLDEAITQTKLTKIQIISTPLHYLVCDAQGECATIESLSGRWVIHRGEDLPISVFTNSIYSKSLENWLRDLASASNNTDAILKMNTRDSLSRFEILAALNSTYNESSDPIKYSFDALYAVEQSNTKWSMIYERTKKSDGKLAIVLHFKSIDAPSEKTLDITKLKFYCDYPLLALNVNAEGSGNVMKNFFPYSSDEQDKLNHVNIDIIGTELVKNVENYLHNKPLCVESQESTSEKNLEIR